MGTNVTPRAIAVLDRLIEAQVGTLGGDDDDGNPIIIDDRRTTELKQARESLAELIAAVVAHKASVTMLQEREALARVHAALASVV